MAERSDGFVCRSGKEAQRAVAAGWPVLHRQPLPDRSFSVRETPEQFRSCVCGTVHGALHRRSDECFEPDEPCGYVMWWVETGHIPDIAEARERVDSVTAKRAGPGAFEFAWLDAEAA